MSADLREMAPSTTNYPEIQNDEIEVLRSIYMDDFVEEKFTLAAWNVRNSFSIETFPRSD